MSTPTTAAERISSFASKWPGFLGSHPVYPRFAIGDEHVDDFLALAGPTGNRRRRPIFEVVRMRHNCEGRCPVFGYQFQGESHFSSLVPMMPFCPRNLASGRVCSGFLGRRPVAGNQKTDAGEKPQPEGDSEPEPFGVEELPRSVVEAEDVV